MPGNVFPKVVNLDVSKDISHFCLCICWIQQAGVWDFESLSRVLSTPGKFVDPSDTIKIVTNLQNVPEYMKWLGKRRWPRKAWLRCLPHPDSEREVPASWSDWLWMIKYLNHKNLGPTFWPQIIWEFSEMLSACVTNKQRVCEEWKHVPRFSAQHCHSLLHRSP